MQTTLRTEIDIVKDYIALEQMRYDFVIEMNVEEGRYLEQPTVRMLLQPLVENAIRYGLGDDEKITIQVFEDNIRGLAGITILDSGNGLTQEEIYQINEPFDYDVKKNAAWKQRNRSAICKKQCWTLFMKEKRICLSIAKKDMEPKLQF